MQSKRWLAVVPSLLAASAFAGCGPDSSAPGRIDGASGASNRAGAAGAAASGAAGAAAGSSNGGMTSSAGAASAGAPGSAGTAASAGSAGTSGAAGSAGGAGTSGAGGSAGMAGSSGTGGFAGSGGTSGTGGTGGTSGIASSGGTAGENMAGSAGAGGGGVVPSPLCDRNLWKYTFQFCPHGYNAFDNQPTLAVDGDTTTFVSSGAAQDGTFYALFDLHGAVAVSSLVLDYGAGDKATDISALVKLQGSNDGLVFSDITAEISGALTANKLVITVPTTSTHRFLKLLQIGSSGSWWAIPELSITCLAGTPIAPPPDAGLATDRAQWKILTPSSACAANGLVGAMVDADTADSAWQSSGRPGVGYWLRVDLGTTAALKGVHLTNKGSDFPPFVKVQVSSDDLIYEDAKVNVPGALDMDIVFAAPKNARFFRIVSEADTAGAWWTIANLDIDL